MITLVSEQGIERFVGNMSYEEFINNEKTIKRRVPELKPINPINEVNTNPILNGVRPAEKGQCCLSLDKVRGWKEDLCGRRLADKAMLAGSCLNGRRTTKYFRVEI